MTAKEELQFAMQERGNTSSSSILMAEICEITDQGIHIESRKELGTLVQNTPASDSDTTSHITEEERNCYDWNRTEEYFINIDRTV